MQLIRSLGKKAGVVLNPGTAVESIAWLLELADIAREFHVEPLLAFLADAGIHTQFDEGLRSEIPRLMAALLILTGRLVVLRQVVEDG